MKSLLDRHGAPLDWRGLVAALGCDSGQGRRDLRRVLRALVGSGEVVQDHRGFYHRGATRGRVGVLERALDGLCFEGVPLADAGRSRLRPGDTVEAIVTPSEDAPTASVLRVIEHSPEPLIGELRWRGRYPYVESLSPGSKGRVSLVDAPAVGEDGDSVAVRIVGEDRHGLKGFVESVVSPADGAAHAADTLLASHEVPVEWPEAASRAAGRLPQSVQPGRHGGRQDLTALPLVTIDGESAKDFDDAVYAERQGNGWRLVVAIADVGHYVAEGSALDRCALERGNSVYLPGRVVPMLPEALSNGLCSLRPDEARLALVCDMRVSARGLVTRHQFYEAVIRSHQRLTYTRVQEFLDTGALDVEPEVTQALAGLHAVFQALRSARDARGALDFEAHEGTIELDHGRVRAIHPLVRCDAHRLIEEAMIAANVCAAAFLEKHGAAALYRVHEPPSAEKVQQVRQALAFGGVRLPSGSLNPRSVHDALAHLGERADRWIFEMLVLRSLSQAYYAPRNKGHFGLALPRYMHFTSPIRRYPDLLVHRAIKAVLHGRDAPVSVDELVSRGEHVSMTERRAQEVEWGVEGWLKCEYVSRRIGESFEGVIVGVADFGVFVELSGYYVQGLLHVSELGTDYFRYQPLSMSLVGERSGRRYGLGDPVTVQLIDAQPATNRLELRLVGARSRGHDRRRGGRRARR